MGWSSEYRRRGLSNRDFFSAMLKPGDSIVECATVRGVFYAAVRKPDGETWALVALIRWAPKADLNFSYKTMSDSSGPCYYDAPAAVLDALTPTDNEYANKWRQECREYLASRAAVPRVKIGDTIRLHEPVSFTNGAVLDTLRLVARGVFADPDTGDRYRLRNYRNRPFTLIRAGA